MAKYITYPNWEITDVHAKSLQPCPTLCDPLDYSLATVHGVTKESDTTEQLTLSPSYQLIMINDYFISY